MAVGNGSSTEAGGGGGARASRRGKRLFLYNSAKKHDSELITNSVSK